MLAVIAMAATLGITPQFDLLCTHNGLTIVEGAKTTVDQPPGTLADFVLRIDLESKKWCDSECKYINPLSITSNRITLLESAEYPWKSDERYLDRISGKFFRKQKLPNGGAGYAETKADCNKKPFSGIPDIKF